MYYSWLILMFSAIVLSLLTGKSSTTSQCRPYNRSWRQKRLVLRQFQFSDCHNIQALASDYEVAKTTYSIPHPYTLENARSWVMRQKNGWDDRSNFSYGLFEKRSQELIGCTSLQNIFNDESRLGYWIGRSYWNRNYCTEATSALVQFAHARLGINKIYAEHQDDNPASGSVLKKL